MPGTTFLVQNNFGGSLGGPVYGKKTFFFANYEAHRRREAQTSIATVPTDQEATGDFSQSGVTDLRSRVLAANPNFNPALPVSASNPQVLRTPFGNNAIPPARMNPAALKMLQSYVPRPNMENGMMGGMTMMGTPTVFGSAGVDSNNLLDVRDARMDSDQGTIRVDRIFDTRRFAERPLLGERRATDSCRRICPDTDSITTTWARMARSSGRASFRRTSSTRHRPEFRGCRCSIPPRTMTSMTLSAHSASPASTLAGRRPGGRPFFNVQGFTPLGDSWLATPMKAWDTVLEGRDTLSWHTGQPQPAVRHQLPPFYLADVGTRAEPRILHLHQRLHHADGDQRRHRLCAGEVSCSGCLRHGRCRTDSPTWICASGRPMLSCRTPGALPAHTTLDAGLRYEFMSALVDRHPTVEQPDE